MGQGFHQLLTAAGNKDSNQCAKDAALPYLLRHTSVECLTVHLAEDALPQQ